MRKPQVFIATDNLNMGGSQKSLLAFLHYIERFCDVDVLVWQKKEREILTLPDTVKRIYIPGGVSVRASVKRYGINSREFVYSVLGAFYKKRWLARPRIKKDYDIAIAFTDLTDLKYYVIDKVNARNKYAFYVLLPDGRNGLGIQALFDCLSADEWEKIIDETRISREVVVFLPSFEISKRYQLKQALVSLGVGKAFSSAGFDRMILKNNKQYSCDLSEVIQKSRIKVTEWGTEAAAVTADLMIGDSGIERKPTVFKADHPFAFVIVEKTSGVILFEGVFTGKE